MTLHHGDCLEVMATLPAGSIDAIVTDPPYDLVSIVKRFGKPDAAPVDGDQYGGRYGRLARGFMGHTWDGTGIAFRPETWAEALRVAKPGAHLLAFGGTRTFHRLACAIEDAGWEIRDTLVWAYASGFPKSHDVSKAIDRAAGATRTEVLGPKAGHEDFVDRTDAHSAGGRSEGWERPWRDDPDAVAASHLQLAPVTPDAVKWNGWGTALKPAWEPIILARKPMTGSVAANVVAHGTGALNIEATRIGLPDGHGGGARGSSGFVDGYEQDGFAASPVGRWPANVVLTDPIFDGDVEGVVGGGETASGFMPASTQRTTEGGYKGRFGPSATNRDTPADAGTYSRFFLIPKADRSDREPILGGKALERRTMGKGLTGVSGDRNGRGGKAEPLEMGAATRANHHPTVKPVELMRHLVRLVTPPGGTVLDPFIGSGTTALAAELEGFAWIGIEKEADYVAIAEARLNGTQKGLGLDAPAPSPKRTKQPRRGRERPAHPQDPLFEPEAVS